MKILILFGHPAFQGSHLNRSMVEDLEQFSHVTLHDLYEAYPELDIDVEHEKALLEEHDCIIFQFPMYWYSSPAIFKEWQDLVLQHGWAYGSKGTALEGKYFFTAITTGAPKISFQREGFQQHTIREFLSPFIQMARLCKMIPLPPFVIHGSHLVSEVRLKRARREFHALLKLLGSDDFSSGVALEQEYLNELIKEED